MKNLCIVVLYSTIVVAIFLNYILCGRYDLENHFLVLLLHCRLLFEMLTAEAGHG